MVRLKDQENPVIRGELSGVFSSLFPKFKVVVVIHEDSSVSVCHENRVLWKAMSETGIVKVNVRTGDVNLGL